jgi:hypothetical protein
MRHKTVNRVLAAAALTAVLALAGARPAAAQELGIVERGLQWLARLWSLPTEIVAMQAHSRTPVPDNATIDKGLGVDPNGGGVVVEPPPLDGN